MTLGSRQKTLRVQINGESRELPDPSTLRDLIKELSLTPERIAVELNQHVVRRSQWAETTLNDGDRLEIVHFVGGGGMRHGKKAGPQFV